MFQVRGGSACRLRGSQGVEQRGQPSVTQNFTGFDALIEQLARRDAQNSGRLTSTKAQADDRAIGYRVDLDTAGIGSGNRELTFAEQQIDAAVGNDALHV